MALNLILREIFNTSVSHNILSVHCDTGGRFILVNIEIDNNCYSLTNIYAPNNPNERNSFFFLSRYQKIFQNSQLGQ